MPWPLQCTHERAELSVDLSVGVGSTGDVLSSASGWDGRRSPASRQDARRNCDPSPGIAAGAIHWRGDGSARE
ncbi:hypothetical protein HDV63DRAFT_380587 [Trichoderma sp. SZMC 28014]